jgi:ribosome biogenesis GTPase / thiamine phosphate phosphatase
MTLEDLGYNENLKTYRKINNLGGFNVGRVISEHKERFVVRTQDKEYDSEITGNLRYTALERSDFPAVGDWVAFSEYDEEKALIHAVFPRKSVIERQAVGKHGEKQIIAANIDVALIIQAVDRDFNINRMERYLILCNASNVEPVIVLNKIDLISNTILSEMLSSIRARINLIPVLAVSNQNQTGISDLKNLMAKGRTYCLLGSSGVGKSSLINSLLGQPMMETDVINESTGKGRHVTTGRELIILDTGSILIDNPGMREVGITDSSEGIDKTFDIITELSTSCKFKNCTHTTESGCAVLEAVNNNLIERGAYENYLKTKREREFFESTSVDKKKRDRHFGKMMKSFKKMRKEGRI